MSSSPPHPQPSSCAGWIMLWSAREGWIRACVSDRERKIAGKGVFVFKVCRCVCEGGKGGSISFIDMMKPHPGIPKGLIQWSIMLLAEGADGMQWPAHLSGHGHDTYGCTSTQHLYTVLVTPTLKYMENHSQKTPFVSEKWHLLIYLKAFHLIWLNLQFQHFLMAICNYFTF